MDQPCVAREISELAVFGLAPMYPASNWSSCSGPSWNPRASDLISVDASIGQTVPSVLGCAGKTVPPSLASSRRPRQVTGCWATWSSKTPHLAQFPCSCLAAVPSSRPCARSVAPRARDRQGWPSHLACLWLRRFQATP